MGYDAASLGKGSSRKEVIAVRRLFTPEPFFFETFASRRSLIFIPNGSVRYSNLGFDTYGGNHVRHSNSYIWHGHSDR